MSEDLKKDILEALHGAQNDNTSKNSGEVVFPDPVVLKHSLDENGVVFPSPVFRQDGKDKK